jgi:AraC-like DNA-binding protein
MRGSKTPARLFGSLFCLGVVGHILTQSPSVYRSLGVATLPVWTLSVIAAGLFWAFALSLFGDLKKVSPTQFLPASALLLIGVAASALPTIATSLWLAHNILGAALMIHVLLIVWTGWRGDLVEARRRLRGPLLGIAALYALTVVAVQSVELYSRPATELSMLAALGLLAMGLGGGAVFLRSDAELFASTANDQSVRDVTLPDQVLLIRLAEAIDGRELWREEGLTIGALATDLNVPEHHVRRLINEGLGYRNFTAFVGERRIAAAQSALTDPTKVRTSIATIAYEVGFGSIGPFNRAFKDATGKTPTDWRKAALAGPPILDSGRS